MHVAIIGGGIVGASVAYHLLRRGARVTVLDRADPGQATAAAAGILPPLDHFASSSSVLPLIKAARAHYAELISALAEDDETDTGYAIVGALQIASDDAEAERLPALARECDSMRAAGFAHIGTVAQLEASEARALFPALSPSLRGAVYTSGAARIDGRRLLAALRGAVLRRGGAWLHGDAEVFIEHGRVLGARHRERTITADAVVIAGGAWSAAVAQALSVNVSVAPQRGQLVHLAVADEETEGWPIVLGFGWNYLLGFPEGRVVAGATREAGLGFAPRPTAAGVHAVLEQALKLAPGLAGATLLEVRVGFRPASADGRPVVGVLAEYPNVFVATGHGGYGLEAGPYSGALIAQLIVERSAPIDLAPFSPDRFR